MENQEQPESSPSGTGPLISTGRFQQSFGNWSYLRLSPKRLSNSFHLESYFVQMKWLLEDWSGKQIEEELFWSTYLPQLKSPEEI